MITVATQMWQPNSTSFPFSRMYDEGWVLRLHDGFARNLSMPFEFIVFTDKPYNLPDHIEQQPITMADPPHYGCCIEAFRLDKPMIHCGLDTVVTGPVDHLAEYCLTERVPAFPRNPHKPHLICNGVNLVPAGYRHIFDNYTGSKRDEMSYLNTLPEYAVIDDLYPGQVLSYKCHVRDNPAGLGDARIVYFHGREKPHELLDRDWIRQHWLGEI